MTASPQYLINGRTDGQISPLDRGFAYGDGVFRTMRYAQGKVLSWELHYRKLLEDCNHLDIVCPTADMLLSDIERLLAGDPAEAAIKIIVTRGEGSRGYALPALAQPNRVVIRAALPEHPPSHLTQGVSLYLCELRLAHQPRLAGIKHLNRLDNVLARMEWNTAEFADGLLLDTDGHVIECTMSNLFIRSGQRLLTPDLSQCGVAGITRQRILEFAPQLGLKAEVASLSLAEVMAADELIICNSLFGAWQVTNFNTRQWPGQPLAAQLRQLLQEQI